MCDNTILHNVYTKPTLFESFLPFPPVLIKGKHYTDKHRLPKTRCGEPGIIWPQRYTIVPSLPSWQWFQPEKSRCWPPWESIPNFSCMNQSYSLRIGKDLRNNL